MTHFTSSNRLQRPASKNALSRRSFISLMGKGGAGMALAGMLPAALPGGFGSGSQDVQPGGTRELTFSMSADEALQHLMDGNKRYVAAKAEHPDQDLAHRAEVAKGQNPFAVIVSCVDSRVPPEIVFDQGLGDLFVIRTAAGVLGDVVIGSIEFGVAEFGIPLVVVLGHERCGAVKATVDAVTKGGHAEGQITSVVEAIRPAVVKAKTMPGSDLLDNAVRANALMICDRLQKTHPILAEAYKDKKLNIVAARYDLDEGSVELLKES